MNVGLMGIIVGGTILYVRGIALLKTTDDVCLF